VANSRTAALPAAIGRSGRLFDRPQPCGKLQEVLVELIVIETLFPT
jgi:hypothetical protein